MSPALFPASRLARLSTIQRRRLASRAPATRLLLRASPQIPIAIPPRGPLQPSVLPNPALRVESRVCLLQCSVHTRDAVARQPGPAPAFLRRQQSAAAQAWRPVYRPQPLTPSDLNCSNRRARRCYPVERPVRVCRRAEATAEPRRSLTA